MVLQLGAARLTDMTVSVNLHGGALKKAGQGSLFGASAIAAAGLPRRRLAITRPGSSFVNQFRNNAVFCGRFSGKHPARVANSCHMTRNREPRKVTQSLMT